MIRLHKKNCLEQFVISVFDPCISRGCFFGRIFRLYKVDLYSGKYGMPLVVTWCKCESMDKLVKWEAFIDYIRTKGDGFY